MNKIVKIIYEDGSFSEIKNINPLEKSEDKKEQWLNRRMYNRQFVSFEEEILDSLDENTIEDYAVERFDLIKEDDVEEKDIDDFTDDEILQEVRDRKLLGKNSSVLSESFIIRFSKIMEKENQILIDTLLTEFETKLSL